MISNESVNAEREKANLLCLFKLTLNTLIDQSSSPTALPVLDDKSDDVTNFILTLERVLNFRMRANWLSERRYFWDFVRPACIGSARQTIIERVEEVSKIRSIKYKGRTWIKFALMEKKLSELLKLVISDCQLVRKFYHDDSIMISSQAFILCDQLAGLSALDFSFCFKQDGSIITPLLLHGSEIDVIDLTPYLSYKSKNLKQLLKDQNNDEENKQPIPLLAAVNELKPLNSAEREMVPLDKHKLEVEQRKYFEELLRHRDNELRQLKNRFEQLKTDRENEVILMENIILELQLELQTARDEAEFKRKKPQQSGLVINSSRNLFSFVNRKANSPTTPTNDEHHDDDTQMRPIEVITIANAYESSNACDENVNQATNSNDSFCIPSQSSRRSSHSTINTEDDQYELVRQVSSNNNQTAADTKVTSSPELLSSATSLSTPTSTSSSSSSCDEDEPNDQPVIKIDDTNGPVIQESGRFETVEMTTEQATLLEEASKTT